MSVNQIAAQIKLTEMWKALNDSQWWPMKTSKIVLVKTVENGNQCLTPKCQKPNSIIDKNAENLFSTLYCLFFYEKIT
jgi:hypothetical protein